VNKRINYCLLGMFSLFAVMRVDAATVFSPVDGNVNYLFGNLQGGSLAMFDDSDQTYLGPSLTITVPSIVGITGPFANNDYVAANTQGILTLSGSNHFILGLNVGGVWLPDSSITSVGGNSYIVVFGSGADLVQVDVQVVPQVPVPAAVWLFGSGLLGLVGVLRRKGPVAV